MNITDRTPVSRLPEPDERIRLRVLFGVTQDELADEVGVSRKTVYAWEHGLSNPTGRKREAYAAVLTAWAQKESVLSQEMRKAGDAVSVDTDGVIQRINGPDSQTEG